MRTELVHESVGQGRRGGDSSPEFVGSAPGGDVRPKSTVLWRRKGRPAGTAFDLSLVVIPVAVESDPS